MERQKGPQSYLKVETVPGAVEAIDTIHVYRSNVKSTGLVKGVLVKKVGSDFIVFTMLTGQINHDDPRYQEVKSFSSSLMPAMEQTCIPISKIYIGSVEWVRNQYIKLKSGTLDS